MKTKTITTTNTHKHCPTYEEYRHWALTVGIAEPRDWTLDAKKFIRDAKYVDLIHCEII